MGPDPDGQKTILSYISRQEQMILTLRYDKYLCFRSFYNNASPG